LGEFWGRPPALDLEREATLHQFVRDIAKSELINSAQDVASGGIAIALAKACIKANVGIHANLSGLKWAHQAPPGDADKPSDGIPAESAFFGEHASMVLVSGSVRNIGSVIQLAQKSGIPTYPCGTIDREFSGRLTISNRNPWGKVDDEVCEIDIALEELKRTWSTALESHLTEEVTA
jgi:phosphoribosylformylglycinamidine synthase subunit PurL